MIVLWLIVDERIASANDRWVEPPLYLRQRLEHVRFLIWMRCLSLARTCYEISHQPRMTQDIEQMRAGQKNDRADPHKK